MITLLDGPLAVPSKCQNTLSVSLRLEIAGPLNKHDKGVGESGRGTEFGVTPTGSPTPRQGHRARSGIKMRRYG